MKINPAIPVTDAGHPAARHDRAAFSLVEVMIALGIFFIAVFAILGVISNALRNARALQQKKVDLGKPAAYMFASNSAPEFMLSGDFEDDYPGHTWTVDGEESGTNGLWRVDIIVQGPSDAIEAKMSILRYWPNTQRPGPGGRIRR